MSLQQVPRQQAMVALGQCRQPGRPPPPADCPASPPASLLQNQAIADRWLESLQVCQVASSLLLRCAAALPAQSQLREAWRPALLCSAYLCHHPHSPLHLFLPPSSPLQ